MKKFFCLTLAVLVMMMSMVCFTASAEDMTSTDCIYFQVPTETSVAWKNFKMVFCHIWSEGNDGGDFNAWQSKNERCTDLGNGYWSYDVSGYEFKEDASYSVIFSNENGLQTYNLNFTSACLGDIVVCEGDTCVNPVDSAKQCTVARWLNNKDTVHPAAQIGSDGGVVDPDGVYDEDIDRTWGSAEGTSVEMPKVEVPTEAEEIEEDTDILVSENPDNETEDKSEIGLTQWILIGVGALLVIVVAVVVIVLVSKRKK